MNEQINLQPDGSSQNSKNNWIIIISIVAIALIVGGGIYAWQRSILKASELSLHQQIIALQNQLNQLKQNKNTNNQPTPPLNDSKAGWKLYEDKVAGFSLKYPADIILHKVNDSYSQTNLELYIGSAKIDSLSNPMGYDKETAMKVEQALRQGNYGESIDWPLDISKKVKNLGPINAQQFMVLSQLDSCSLRFERNLIFFNNSYEVTITLQGPKDIIISHNPQYFATDEENCGEETIWNFEKQDQFYQDLAEGKLTGEAQKWFNLFDDIVNTIEIK
ncbi:MAG: hypothetical protein V1712_00900 [Patescibacteria group bacterium]